MVFAIKHLTQMQPGRNNTIFTSTRKRNTKHFSKMIRGKKLDPTGRQGLNTETGNFIYT